MKLDSSGVRIKFNSNAGGDFKSWWHTMYDDIDINHNDIWNRKWYITNKQ